jgi:Protein of unknown function (DUF4232)
MTRRIGRLVVVGAVVLGLGACSGGSHAKAASTTTGPPASGTTTSTTVSPTTSVSTLPPTTLPPTTLPPTTAVPAPVSCRSAALTVVLAGWDGAAGTFYSQIVFRNDSGSPCALIGYPGVSFLTASGAQIGVPAQRTGATYARVTLASGARAYATLAVPDPGVRMCPSAIAQFVRVFPPNETRPVLISAQGIRVCAQQIPPASIAPVVDHPTG